MDLEGKMQKTRRAFKEEEVGEGRHGDGNPASERKAGLLGVESFGRGIRGNRVRKLA
jgi:hypothetical protein